MPPEREGQRSGKHASRSSAGARQPSLSPEAEALCGSAARRVTLMISYWRTPHATADRGAGPPVAAMRFPPPGAAAWTAPFYAAVAPGAAPKRPSLPVPVGALWARLPADADDDYAEVPLPAYEECFQGF